VYVREDYPPEVESRRRVLRPILTKAKKMEAYKGKCRLSHDKLIVKLKTFTVEPINNLDKLPADLSPRSSAERENDNVIVFFTQGSPLFIMHLLLRTMSGTLAMSSIYNPPKLNYLMTTVHMLE
jgi:hypothetical protein